MAKDVTREVISGPLLRQGLSRDPVSIASTLPPSFVARPASFRGRRVLFVGGIGRAGQTPASAPPPLETFENDADRDGVPDGWYNFRDARLVKGGKVKAKDKSADLCLRFDNDKPSRPARASTAFAVDGRETEALIIGLWVKLKDPQPGEREARNRRWTSCFSTRT